MRLRMILGALLLLSSSMVGQDELFDKGNQAYQEGNYQLAIEFYDSILGAGKESAALYYNLANSHYQSGALALSILNYEKALLLQPGDEEILHNLSLAEKQRVDRFEAMPPNLFKAFRLSILQVFSPDNWARLGLAFLLIALIGLAFYLFSSRGRIGFVAMIGGVLFCLFSMVMAFSHKQHQQDHPKLIVMSDSAYVKSGPGTEAEDLFILHAGTKVEKIDFFDAWVKLKLIDGKIGWLPESDLEAIN